MNSLHALRRSSFEACCQWAAVYFVCKSPDWRLDYPAIKLTVQEYNYHSVSNISNTPETLSWKLLVHVRTLKKSDFKEDVRYYMVT